MKRRMLSWGLILSLLLTMLPVSAGAAVGHSNHTGWTPLSGTISSNNFYQDGNYYLNSDVTANSNITINNNVTLCLNGHTLNIGQNTTFTVSSDATLTICDCQSDGTIKGNKSRINLNVISVEGGTLNLESVPSAGRQMAAAA